MMRNNNIVAFVPTTDAAQARSFYHSILGLPVLSEDQFAIALDANGVMLRLVKLQDFTPAKFTILGWEVPNIEESVSELGEKGVVFENYGLENQDSRGIWRAPGGAKVAWFKDPTGNVLSLTQF